MKHFQIPSFSVLIIALALPHIVEVQSSAEKLDFKSSIVDIEGLGAMSFPNSGAAEAQEAFFRGVLLLHSFEFTQAAEAFRKAQDLDSDFALAYWGEAMTYNHPLWGQFDGKKGQAALLRLAPTREARQAKAPTERERRYLNTIETLFFFEGEKETRDRAYMKAMRDLHETYPEDDEARAFYALSILGSKNGSRDFATYMQAGAMAQPIFDRNPRHPGAAHYIIHSFDDPIHAPLGLAAANAYADIAPDAAHAQHMTSHIFVALGLWERTMIANVRARNIEDADRAKRGKKANICGHYSAWLHYAYLQLGEVSKAEAMMDLALERVEDNATKSEWGYFVDMRSRQIVDTEDWAQASRWTVSLDQFPSDKGGRGYGTAHFRYQITNALAGLYLGNDSLARVLLEQSRPEEPGQALQIDQLAGLLAIQDGKVEAGLQLLNQAAEAEDALPLAYGPPELVEPAYESLGKSLLAQGHWKEAAAAYRRAIERTPRRPLAVDGFAKAAKQLSADELSSIKVTNKKSAGTARISRKAQEICLPATSG